MRVPTSPGRIGSASSIHTVERTAEAFGDTQFGVGVGGCQDELDGGIRRHRIASPGRRSRTLCTRLHVVPSGLRGDSCSVAVLAGTMRTRWINDFDGSPGNA